MTDVREALVERIVALYADKYQITGAWLASAARDLVLEEAANVAEAYPASTHGALATAPYAAAEQAADEIAVAIRALKHSS